VNSHIFFCLRVLKDSTSNTRRIHEFRMNTSWSWHPGASLLLGPKYSSYHLCRLLGQIGWHTSTFESGISPLCLQIYFCINTSFGTPQHLNRVLALCVCRSIFSSTHLLARPVGPIYQQDRHGYY